MCIRGRERRELVCGVSIIVSEQVQEEEDGIDTQSLKVEIEGVCNSRPTFTPIH